MSAVLPRCRVCGCTDDDCRPCIQRTGEPCWWIEDNLCSACAALILSIVSPAAEPMSPPREEAEARGFWYLASPYSAHPHGFGTAFLEVAVFAGRLVVQGIPVFSPIVHYHWVAELARIDSTDHALWLPVLRPIAEAARGLILFCDTGWEQSHGMTAEKAWFREAGKPIYWYQPGADLTGFVHMIKTGDP